MDRSVKISPSLLSADFGAFAKDAMRLTEAGADYLHFDIMDGHFVQSITFGPDVLSALRSKSDVSFDVHLMIENPQNQIEVFAAAGANMITVHPETCYHLHRVIHQIKDLGVKASAALNPATPIESIEWVLEDLERVLVMTVNPGFGGQAFIPGTLHKIEELRNIEAERRLRFEIAVDGGITTETAPQVVRAGADVLIAGSYVFHHPDGPAGAIAALRDSAKASEGSKT